MTTHEAWRTEDVDGVGTLLAEAKAAGQDPDILAFSLLYVGTQLIEAAAAGCLEEFREQYLGAALIAEVATEEAL